MYPNDETKDEKKDEKKELRERIFKLETGLKMIETICREQKDQSIYFLALVGIVTITLES